MTGMIFTCFGTLPPTSRHRSPHRRQANIFCLPNASAVALDDWGTRLKTFGGAEGSDADHRVCACVGVMGGRNQIMLMGYKSSSADSLDKGT